MNELGIGLPPISQSTIGSQKGTRKNSIISVGKLQSFDEQNQDYEEVKFTMPKTFHKHISEPINHESASGGLNLAKPSFLANRQVGGNDRFKNLRKKTIGSLSIPKPSLNGGSPGQG